MTLALAFAAAFLAALTLVTQHVASTRAAPDTTGWQLAGYLLTNRLWLIGVAATLGSFLAQAGALYYGRLSVVQAISVSELLFSLAIGRVWLRQAVPSAAWVSSAVTATGLGVFLVMSEPQGGHAEATASAWLPALASVGALTALCVVLARSGSPRRRAMLYAAAAGTVSATMATFLKSTTDTIGLHGILAAFRTWPSLGLIAAGILSAVLTQAALHQGPLTASQPVLVISNPVVSVALGVWLYGEHFTQDLLHVVLGLLGFVAMIVGAVLLAQTSPSLEGKPRAPVADQVARPG